MDKDYYKILGITKKSSFEEIKKAYRNLALIWHPDKNKDPLALDKFKDISEAFQVLQDKDKREEYDSFLNYQNNRSRSAFSFPRKDPFEIFDEVFSMINGIQNTIMAFDAMMNINNINSRNHMNNFGNTIMNMINMDPNPGMTIHIIDMSAGMNGDNLNRPSNRIKIEEVIENNNHIKNNIVANNKQNNSRPLLLENNKINKNNNSKWITNNGNGFTSSILNEKELNNVIVKAFAH